MIFMFLIRLLFVLRSTLFRFPALQPQPVTLQQALPQLLRLIALFASIPINPAGLLQAPQ